MVFFPLPKSYLEYSCEGRSASQPNLGATWNSAAPATSGANVTTVTTVEQLRLLAFGPVNPALDQIEINIGPPSATKYQSSIGGCLGVLVTRYGKAKIEKLRVAELPVDFEDILPAFKGAAWSAGLRQLKLTFEVPDNLWIETDIDVTFRMAQTPFIDFGQSLGPRMWKGTQYQDLESLKIEGAAFKPLSKADIEAVGRYWGVCLHTLHLGPNAPASSDILGTPIELLSTFNSQDFPVLRSLGLRVDPNPSDGYPTNTTPLAQLEDLDVGTSTPPTDKRATVDFLAKLLPNGHLIAGPPPYQTLEDSAFTWADVVSELKA